MKHRVWMMLLLMLTLPVLASCAAPKTVDTFCQTAPRGTAHIEDTPGTKRWMRTYEVTRQKRCK